MKIAVLETLRSRRFPNLLWVRVHTDAGVTGTGEAYKGVRAVESYLHETVFPEIIGADPLEIEGIDRKLQRFQFSISGIGAEVRGNAAVNLALWDLWGRATGQPLYQLLGGRCRERIRIYNTCAGPQYQRSQPRQSVANFGLPEDGAAPRRHEDLDAFLNRPAELARELLDEGCTGMKIWPFDRYAEASGGHHISAAEIERGLEPFRRIREEVGDAMDLMVEMHGQWDLPAAIEIGRALEPIRPYWIEDPIRMNDLGALKAFRDAVPVRLAASELLGSVQGFRDLFATRAAGVALFDICWCGGLTEARKIAALAEAHSLPVTPHDCTGPLLWAASVHLSLHAPTALVQECVRAAWDGWYGDIAEPLPPVENGHARAPDGPGLGTGLREDFLQADDIERQILESS